MYNSFSSFVFSFSPHRTKFHEQTNQTFHRIRLSYIRDTFSPLVSWKQDSRESESAWEVAAAGREQEAGNESSQQVEEREREVIVHWIKWR